MYYKYDYDIRKTFDDVLGENMFYSLDNTIDDKEMLRLATELLRFSRDRLDGDLDNDNIFEEYIKLNVGNENNENNDDENENQRTCFITRSKKTTEIKIKKEFFKLLLWGSGFFRHVFIESLGTTL